MPSPELAPCAFDPQYRGLIRVPLDDFPPPVMQRHFAMHHPTIFPVGTPYTAFMFEYFAACQARSPLVHNPLDVVWMNHARPVPALHVLERGAKVFQPAPIEVIEVAIRPPGVDQGWDGIDHYAQIALVRLESLFCAFTVLDFG